MMEPVLWMIILAFFCWSISPVHVLSFKRSQKNGGCNKTKRRLIVILMDGFRWDYLHGRGRTPTFDALKRKGVFAEKGITNTFITNTLPSLFTLVTGLYSESHGMIDNLMQDDTIDPRLTYIPVFYYHNIYNDPRWYSDIEPIWISNQLQRHDGRSGLLLWVGGDAPMKGVLPSRFILHTFNMPEITQIDHLMKWLTDENDPINLGMVYFPEPDNLSHIYGPESDQVTRKIEDLDRTIQYLLDQLEYSGLASTTDIIVLSDHGFLTISQDNIINLDDILEREWYHVITPMPSSGLSIFPYKEGNHGYDNSNPLMRPIFMAFGPSFKENVRFETLNNVDVYPLMCHLLGLKPQPHNGSMEYIYSLLRDEETCAVY